MCHANQYAHAHPHGDRNATDRYANKNTHQNAIADKQRYAHQHAYLQPYQHCYRRALCDTHSNQLTNSYADRYTNRKQHPLQPASPSRDQHGHPDPYFHSLPYRVLGRS